MTKVLRLRPVIAMVGIAVIAVAAVWTMIGRYDIPESGHPGVGVDPAAAAPALGEERDTANDPQDARGKMRSAASLDAARLISRSLHSRYACEPDAVDLRYCATNEDEAAWLRQRGFPSVDEAAYVRGAPDHELEARATRGDAVAAMELVRRHRLAGREQDALRWRRDPLNRGSVYAHNAMADLLLASADPQDIAIAAIHLRVAQQLGEVRAMFRLHRLIDENPGLDWRGIDFPAMAMIQTIELNTQGTCLFSGVRPVRSRE